jgi:CheY-like chemotaxis protein
LARVGGQLNKILVIEDSKLFLRALTLCLQDAGYSVVCAPTGEEGVAAARQERPDLILLDMVLPRLDGMMVLRILNADPITGEIPVLVLSGNPKTQDIAEAKKLGVVDYYVKDSMPAERLVQKVKAILLNRHATKLGRPA